MQVGVGYSDLLDSDLAALQAANRALTMANRKDPCNLVLLFSTASHNPNVLRGELASIFGPDVPIVGGGAVGAITNSHLGYGGDQIGLAAMWLDKVGCDLVAKGPLVDNEFEIGIHLGKRMAQRGVHPNTPSMLFYDAVRDEGHGVGLNLATPLLQGLEKGLGFLPNHLIGAGLQGDFDNSSYKQWLGSKVVDQHAIILTFSDRLRIDSVIMHGCKPSGQYFTVTKAEKQTILEIDGQPALSYIHSQLTPSIPIEDFPFFMIFGINRDPTGEYREENYANRLCLAIDKDRNGIVMFESDMVEGTKFQIMYRSLDLDYMPPKINSLFDRVEKDGRKPVFATYIDCAGRSSRFSGDEEDGTIVQQTVGDRVPLLGIYSGVEIAPILGRPRTLDWTGVFSLMSVAK